MPHQPVKPLNRSNAKRMRHEPTEEENILWHTLRGRRLEKLKFKRQVPIGNYIADFVCMEEKLIIEVDGVQHIESDYDIRRDAELKARGFTVLRFWNDEIRKDLDNVCQMILGAAGKL